ncbi:MAG: hypothetical protein KBF88_06885, partial [Polyangiaceae bacterium]|nr:hypothetical protein [Polyangiaceae bacterium]
YGPFTPENIDPNFLFFANRVQPLLVKKGCMMAQCHTPSQFNEYRIRGGSGGNFSLVATRKNYELSLEQLAVESPNVNASRLVRKNLFRPEVSPGGSGILHRGGPLLEDFTGQNADAALCDPATNYDTVDLNDPKVPAYCIINEWHKRERATRNPAPLSAVVFVKRPTMPANFRAQDFGEFAPGAELHLTQVTLGGPAPVLGADTNLNAGCGFTGSVDIRRPSVSWDGKTIAFAARLSAAEPLKIYTAAADGTNCKLHVEANAGAATENGLLVHNFDPAFSPPDAAGESTLVFASTRGNLRKEAYDYAGPQRTPSDPSKLNANLYAYAPGKPIRQMTFLLNTEREVSFMADGRLIFSAEKRAKDFYQLSLRRQNLDGGDYHPLFAQRGSIGFLEARNVVELLDRNLATVMSDPGVPFGGGTLAIINRSIGLDFQSKDATQYPLDPTVIDPASRTSPDPAFFLRSLRFSDPTVGAKPNVATTGLFYAPSPFPDGRVLVSYGAATNTSSFTGDYDLYLVDPVSGQRTKLLGDTGPAEIEAAAVFGRPARRLLTSNSEEPNGKTRIVQTETDATVHILDTPLLASLLFQNTPTGRPVEKLETVELLEDLPPPTTVADYAQGGANVATDAFGKVYVRRRSLGQITLATDGSTRFKVPGGLPVLFRLPDTDDSRKGQWPRLQRESYAFYPGERANQSFKREFFDSLCGTCHNSLSGSPLDASSRPDILTQASVTLSRDAKTIDLNMPPAQRGKEEGP